jgi:hypothetical protein
MEKIDNNLNIELYISCARCKNIEDTFSEGEKPEDYGWTFRRNKWYCASCICEEKLKQ